MHDLAPIRWRPRPARSAGPDDRFEAAEFDPALKTQLLVLQGTPFCNIDCSYCYLPDRASTARMSLATVRQAARWLRDDGLLDDALTVVWHAGEPLTMPLAFYDDAIAAIAAEIGGHCKVSHAIQTNAMLIDDAWCALFKRHAISIGVSVDGPRELHDRHRRTRGGRGTFERVVRGMGRLREHGIPFHAIAVVTDATFAQPDAFCEFFEQQGIDELGCNFDEAEGQHRTSSVAGHEADHAAFIERLLDRSLAGGRLRVRELTSAFELIARPLPQVRWRGRALPANTQALPFAIVSVAWNGDFSTFSPELLGQSAPRYGDFVLGNVAQTGFLASMATPAFARLWGDIARGIGRCERECRHFGYCGGGAPANKFYENADLASAQTLYCRTMVKRPFDAVLARLERERAEGRNAQEALCRSAP